MRAEIPYKRVDFFAVEWRLVARGLISVELTQTTNIL